MKIFFARALIKCEHFLSPVNQFCNYSKFGCEFFFILHHIWPDRQENRDGSMVVLDLLWNFIWDCINSLRHEHHLFCHHHSFFWCINLRQQQATPFKHSRSSYVHFLRLFSLRPIVHKNIIIYMFISGHFKA